MYNMNYIILPTVTSLLCAFALIGCCDRQPRNHAISNQVILVLNSNDALPVTGCILAKQQYHLMDNDERTRVKAVIELQTKNPREDVRRAAAQTLVELNELDKIL